MNVVVLVSSNTQIVEQVYGTPNIGVACASYKVDFPPSRVFKRESVYLLMVDIYGQDVVDKDQLDMVDATWCSHLGRAFHVATC